MTASNEPGFGTKAIHAGQRPDEATGAVMTPVYQNSTYAQESPGVIKGRYDYARSANPTRDALEANLAALEGGRYGLCFASGLAAMAAVVHLLDAGDHVVLCDDVYGGSFRLLDKVFRRQGITVTRADLTVEGEAESAMTDRTKLLWLESPTNPMLKVIDIEAMAKVAHGGGALLAVDNTFATPYLQTPLSLGADIVAHSATKYLGGHSDLVGGALVMNDDDLLERLRFLQNAVGAVPGPWDCFLVLRSTKTLHVRMERHCENARRIAGWLALRDDVLEVRYPGLESHPQHTLAARQMKDFGGMITMVLDGGLDRARRFLERVSLFTLAESLGGVESLIEHPAIMTHASVPQREREEIGIVDGLVRLSVGIEDADDLLADLEHALS